MRPSLHVPTLRGRQADRLHNLYQTTDCPRTRLRALEIVLSEETLKKLDEIFPGHKPSPEGYAW